MALQYVGKRVTDNPDTVYKDYITGVKSADKSMAEIDADIAHALAGYATVGYAKAGDAKNATKAYIDGIPGGVNPNGGDAARLPLDVRGEPGGSVPLDATGKIPSNFIEAAPDQRWVQGPWTPPEYFDAVQPVTVEKTVYSCTVKDPNYPYKVVVFGHLDARSTTHTEYLKLNVRVNDQATGEIVAAGTGPAESSETVIPTYGDKFTTSVPVGLGPYWSVLTTEGEGGYYNVSGGQANYIDGGQVDHTIRYRYLGGPGQGEDGQTKTDYQKIRMTIGNPAGEDLLLGLGNPQYVRLCARMNKAEDQWVGFEITHNKFTMKYCQGGVVSTIPDLRTGPGWVTTGSSFSTDPAPGTNYDILAGTANNLRQFYFYRNNVLIGQALDGGGVSSAGSGNRYWGWYGHAAARGLQPVGGQTTPPSIAELLVTDAPPARHHVSLVPVNLQNATVLRGDNMLYIRAVRSGTTSVQNIYPYKPRLTVFTVPV